MTNLWDGSGIYTIGPQNNASITDNWVHDIYGGSYWGITNLNNGIFLDGCSADIYLGNNVTYAVANAADLRLQTASGYEPVRISYGTNYWNNPATSGTPLTIKNASGTAAAAPNDLTIEWSANYSSFTVTGNSEAWAQLDSAYINENSQTVLSSLTIEKNGAIHGTVSASLVTTSTVTLKVTVKDPDGHVSSVATSNTINAPVVNPNLVAWYKFDESSGTTLIDSVGGHNATINGSGGSWITGKSGNAYNFNATAYAQANGAAVPGGTQQTVALWFNGNASIVNGSGYPAGTAFYSNSGTVNYLDTTYSTGLGAVAGTFVAGSGYTNQTSPVALNAVIKYGWHHIATVKNATAGTMKVYLDGVLVTTATGMTESIPASTNLFIGSSIYGGVKWNGAIDDMRIYDSALSGDQISDIYSSGDRVGWWKFDENTGTTAFDSVGTNNGTISNASWVTGKSGSALNFNSVGNVSIPTAAIADVNTGVTVSFWQWDDAAKQTLPNDLLYSYGANGGKLYIEMPNTNGHLIWVASPNWTDQTAKLNPPSGDIYGSVWHHWVFTKNCSTGYLKIWLNGSLYLSSSGFTQPIRGDLSTSFNIGCSSYHGKIDDVRVYKRELSSTEIGSIYNLAGQ